MSNDTPSVPPVPSNEPASIPTRWLKMNHKAPHDMTQYLYAAFGSNLMLEQMARRCPECQIVGPGKLRGARLTFSKYASIVADENTDVLLGIYKLTASDIANLDRFEGLGTSYDRVLVTPEIDGNAVRCFTYIKKTTFAQPPSDDYFGIILRGYKDWRFPDRRLRRARERSVADAKKGWGNNYNRWEPANNRSSSVSGYAKNDNGSKPTSHGIHLGVRGKWIKMAKKDWQFEPQRKIVVNVRMVTWGRALDGTVVFTRSQEPNDCWWRDMTPTTRTDGFVEGWGPYDARGDQVGPPLLDDRIGQEPEGITAPVLAANNAGAGMASLMAGVTAGTGQNTFTNDKGETWDKIDGVWLRRKVN